ncbi:Exosome complex component ski6-like protein [Elsinoe fawcettii]|nr:Exosome complex component ski6-like protein [Elsinoe fawcettii]
MPLDTSLYPLSQLRIDGRRWNELRRLTGQISTQRSSSGSSYLETGNTKILCTVTGPSEGKRIGRSDQSPRATLSVAISVAPFASTDRRLRARTDKRTTELQHLLEETFAEVAFLHLYPHSSVQVTLHVLSSDGGLVAGSINATTLALVDAGVPMPDYVVACTAGSSGSYASNDVEADPLLDLNAAEEVELPFVTVATVGGGEGTGEARVVACLCETRVQAGRMEGMVAVAVDGCREVRRLLDGIVRAHGEGVVARGKV